jgi:hypothetical protein
MKFLSQKNAALFAVVLIAALASFVSKAAMVAELPDFDSMNGTVTMRYLEAAKPAAFQYLINQISPNDKSAKTLDRIRKYHIGLQRSTHTLVVYKRKSQTIVGVTAVTDETIAMLEKTSSLLKKSGGNADLNDDDESSTNTKFSSLLSDDLAIYSDTQSAIPEYLPADSLKRSFGVAQKVDGGSISFEASQTTYMKSVESISSIGQKASLIFKQSMNKHAEAGFEITKFKGGVVGDDTAGVFTLTIKP